jgi:hypothetical protein
MRQKTVPLSCTVPDQMERYIAWLLAAGLHGETRSAVVARMICAGVAAHVPPEIVRDVTRNGGGAPPS